MQSFMFEDPRSCTIFCFSLVHYAPNYVNNTFLLCFVHRQHQKREQKHTTKNFVGFHKMNSLLTTVAQPQTCDDKTALSLTLGTFQSM